MKKILLIFAMFISSIAFAQECHPNCPEFDFSCEINPLELTDEEIQNFSDRDALLQALVGLTSDKGNVITKVEYLENTSVFEVKVTVGIYYFTVNTDGFGDELILDDMEDENFLEFYKYILDYAITKL